MLHIELSLSLALQGLLVILCFLSYLMDGAPCYRSRDTARTKGRRRRLKIWPGNDREEARAGTVRLAIIAKEIGKEAEIIGRPEQVAIVTMIDGGYQIVPKPHPQNEMDEATTRMAEQMKLSIIIVDSINSISNMKVKKRTMTRKPLCSFLHQIISYSRQIIVPNSTSTGLNSE